MIDAPLDTFRQFMEKYTALPAGEWMQIANCFEKRMIEKDELLLEQGKVCRHLYFLESGLLRFFTFKDGNDVTKFFTDAPYCFTSQASFNAEKPATENIQAIEKSVAWQIPLKQTNDLLALKSWADFARQITREVQFFTEEILEELQTETAEFRYEKMLRDSPALVRRVPLKHLASYLGIAPQSLSRIRKKMATQKRT